MYAKKVSSTHALTLLPPVTAPSAKETSGLPKIRTILRHQVKLLRSTSIALMLMGFWATIMVWVSAEPYRSELTIYDYYIIGLICVESLLCLLFLLSLSSFVQTKWRIRPNG